MDCHRHRPAPPTHRLGREDAPGKPAWLLIALGIIASFAVNTGCRNERSGAMATDDPGREVVDPAPELSRSEPSQNAKRVQEDATDAGPAPFMQAHAAVINKVLLALMQGNVDEVTAAARWLAQRGGADDSREDVVADSRRLVAIAERLSEATVAEDAAVIAVELSTACGRCHVALGVGPMPEASIPRPDGQSFVDHMRLHRWSIETMWASLIQPSDSAWLQGTRTLAESPTHIRNLSSCGDSAAEIVALEESVHALARTGAQQRTIDQRRILLGRLLAGCAGCHVRSTTMCKPQN